MEIHGMAHITGGGLPENLPRCLGAGQAIALNRDSWIVPPIFQWLATAGQVSLEAMLNTFNMGIGYGVIVPSDRAEDSRYWFESQGFPAFAIGEVVPGEGVLRWQ
jgi:phosphoribosylformylglycinamidine cyclo-ligase